MKKYLFNPYNPLYPQFFSQEKERIQRLINETLLIEHIGSTSVPNLSGKGAIDLLIGIPQSKMEELSQELQKIGYIPHIEYTTIHHYYYTFDSEEGIPYRLHLTFPQSKDWKVLIGFRDYLRSHPDAVAEYSSFKEEAAVVAGGNPTIYRKLKRPYLKKIYDQIDPPKRFALFGLPGGGKSTFAAQLSRTINIPVYHLDRHFFIANWKERERSLFMADQEKMVNENTWIIEGNSIGSLEVRFSKADAVLYFHLPRWICIWRALKRIFHYDSSLIDTPEGCSKNISWKLLKYLWVFEKEKRPLIEELRKKYPLVDFREIRSSSQAENYLNEVRNLYAHIQSGQTRP